jgi:hypothetical protein
MKSRCFEDRPTIIYVILEIDSKQNLDAIIFCHDWRSKGQVGEMTLPRIHIQRIAFCYMFISLLSYLSP